MPGPLLLLRSDDKVLIVRARMALGMTQEEFGHALGASKRTATRWDGSGSSPSIAQVRTLAGLVYPRDPDLAAQLAEAAGATLEGLGIVVPAPPPAPPVVVAPPPPPPPPPIALVVQAVVCAAAEALNAPPSTVRPAVLAAFRMARGLGLGVEQVEDALAQEAGKSSSPLPA